MLSVRRMLTQVLWERKYGCNRQQNLSFKSLESQILHNEECLLSAADSASNGQAVYPIVAVSHVYARDYPLTTAETHLEVVNWKLLYDRSVTVISTVIAHANLAWTTCGRCSWNTGCKTRPYPEGCAKNSHSLHMVQDLEREQQSIS